MALTGLREDEEIYRAYQDRKNDQHDDKEPITEGLLAEELLQGPGSLEVAGGGDLHRLGGVLRHKFHHLRSIEFQV